MILTIALNHTVAVIAHIAKELDNKEAQRLGIYKANHLSDILKRPLKKKQDFKNQSFIFIICSFPLPGYNVSHNKPTPSSHNADDQGKASHTWRTQNAANKKKRTLNNAM